jgi:hypothetical protein
MSCLVPGPTGPGTWSGTGTGTGTGDENYSHQLPYERENELYQEVINA